MNSPTPWKIVIIDDEADIREVMAITLEDAGYQVVAASDGESGLSLCRQVKPQIVVTDIRMPGMDGLQVLQTLKQRQPEVEVIVVTAFADMELAIQSLQLDASDFITKPINDEALHLSLRRARQRYTSRRQLSEYTDLLEREAAASAKELFRTYTYQKNLLESSMDGILGCDASGTVITFNRSLAQMLGFSPARVVHRMTLDQFFNRQELERLRTDLATDRFGGRDRLLLYETNLLNRAQTLLPVQISVTTVFNQGKADGVVCFVRDLSQIRKLEQEVADQARILHQDKMMSLGRLAASVVHEINNPLAGILNYIRLILRILAKGALSPAHSRKFRDYLELVEKETERCSRIVSNLLMFSRKSSARFESLRISELIERCRLLSRHKLELQNIQLETAIADDLPEVTGDLNQLQQCIINLIFNAVDAMPHGGRLELNACHERTRNLVQITVTDSGAGIAPADLEHIFEPFFTTKEEGHGTGLGLSTVYGIMQRHHGDVDVDSQVGRGSRFTLNLPLKSTPSPGCGTEN